MVKNISRRKTSTGHAELIDLNMEVKCGGAVVRPQKMLLDASLQSTLAKKTRMKMSLKVKEILTVKKTQSAKAIRIKTQDVIVAKRKDTVLKSALVTQISRQLLTFKLKRKDYPKPGTSANYSLIP